MMYNVELKKLQIVSTKTIYRQCRADSRQLRQRMTICIEVLSLRKTVVGLCNATYRSFLGASKLGISYWIVWYNIDVSTELPMIE